MGRGRPSAGYEKRFGLEMTMGEWEEIRKGYESEKEGMDRGVSMSRWMISKLLDVSYQMTKVRKIKEEGFKDRMKGMFDDLE
jgi:hypothetical protein